MPVVLNTRRAESRRTGRRARGYDTSQKLLGLGRPHVVDRVFSTCGRG